MTICIVLSGCAGTLPDKDQSITADTETTEKAAEKATEKAAESISGTGSDKEYPIDKNMIYREEKVNLDLPVEEIIDIIYCREKLYICGRTEASEVIGDNEIRIYYNYSVLSCNMDGAELIILYTFRSPDYDGSQEIKDIAADEAGNVFLVIRESNSKNWEYHKLVKLDSKGNELWTVELPGKVDGYPGMICDGDRVLVLTKGNVEAYDSLGNKTVWVNLDDRNYPTSIKAGRDGLFVVELYDYYTGDQRLASVDLETEQIGEKTEAAWKAYYTNMEPGGESGYDFIVRNEVSAAGWNYGEETWTELLNFLDSDIGGGDICSLTALADNRIVTVRGSYFKSGVGILTKAAPEEVEEKQVITLGCLDADCIAISPNRIADDILRFNRSNDQYRIKLMDYSAYGKRAKIQMNLDIATGDYPDIFMLNSRGQLTTEAYIRQGLFEDLYPWIDRDPEMKREDFLTNIFDAHSTDGCLYWLPTAFRLNAYSVREADWTSDLEDWSLEALDKLAQKYSVRPNEIFGGRPMRREWFLEEALQYGQFVDKVKGSCCFDSPEFIELLEWVRDFPPEELPEESSSRVVRAVSHRYDNSFSNYYRSNCYNGNLVYVGFPGTPGRNRAQIKEGMPLIAMSAQSKNKEGVWQFIRYYLTEEYQAGITESALPVRIDVLESLAEARLAYEGPPNIFVMTKEQVDSAIACIKSANRIENSDDKIYNIVMKEADLYFNGQKSAAEAARVIQNKVKLYLEE